MVRKFFEWPDILWRIVTMICMVVGAWIVLRDRMLSVEKDVHAQGIQIQECVQKYDEIVQIKLDVMETKTDVKWMKKYLENRER